MSYSLSRARARTLSLFLSLSLALSLTLNLIYLLFREDTVALPYQPSVTFCQCCPCFTRNSGDGGREGGRCGRCVYLCVCWTDRERERATDCVATCVWGTIAGSVAFGCTGPKWKVFRSVKRQITVVLHCACWKCCFSRKIQQKKFVVGSSHWRYTTFVARNVWWHILWIKCFYSYCIFCACGINFCPIPKNSTTQSRSHFHVNTQIEHSLCFLWHATYFTTAITAQQCVTVSFIGIWFLWTYLEVL